MSRRLWIMTVAGLAVVAVAGFFLWRQPVASAPGSAPRQAAVQAADDFWAAVATGNRSAAAALLAPGASLSLDQVIHDFQGMQYTRGAIQLTDAEVNRCGLRYVAVSGLADRSGFTHSELLYLKQVDGRWLIHQTSGELCE